MKKIFSIMVTLFLASCKASPIKFKDSNLFEAPPFYDEVINADVSEDNKK